MFFPSFFSLSFSSIYFDIIFSANCDIVQLFSIASSSSFFLTLSVVLSVITTVFFSFILLLLVYNVYLGIDIF